MGKNKARLEERLQNLLSSEDESKSSKLLMRHGFLLVLLNILFGLMPASKCGSRFRYRWCSFSQIYSLIFGAIMIYLSVIFVPMVVRYELAVMDEASQTSIIILMLSRVLHVGGFILLFLRGPWVAKGLQELWDTTASIIYESSLYQYGKQKGLVKLVKRYVCISLIVYTITIGLHVYTVLIFRASAIMEFFVSRWEDIDSTNKTFEGLTNEYEVPGIPKHFDDMPYAYIGFVVWDSCNMSHVFVSILAAYFVKMITMCLKSINMKLLDEVEQINSFPQIKKPQMRLLENYTPHFESAVQALQFSQLELVMDQTRRTYQKAQKMANCWNNLWGISLIIEVVILVGNILVNLFHCLGTAEKLGKLKQGPDEKMQLFMLREIIIYLLQGFIHFFFFLQLSRHSTDMTSESKEPLWTLKNLSYLELPPILQNKVLCLKADLSSYEITLTATNYFQVNKVLITSVIGSVFTYLIVLLQFQAQEQAICRCELEPTIPLT